MGVLVLPFKSESFQKLPPIEDAALPQNIAKFKATGEAVARSGSVLRAGAEKRLHDAGAGAQARGGAAA